MLNKMIKNKKIEKIAFVHVHTTFNNTIITITNLLGQVLCWSSAGQVGLKGARKNTAFAAQLATKKALSKAVDLGISKVHIVLNGRGNGRETSIRAIQNEGIEVLSIIDKIKVAHNGCRPPKRRRL